MSTEHCLITASPAASTALLVPTDAEGLADAFLAGYGASTAAAYRRDLRAWGTYLATINVQPLAAHRVHVDAWVRSLDGAASASTVARRLSTISGFYAYALDEGLVDRSPVARVKRPKVSDESPRFGLDKDEARALLAASDRKPRDHGLAALLLLNGLRVSEALAADVDDLSHERGHRTLRLTRKGGKIVVVPLAPRTAAAVDALVGDRTEGPIFQTRTGARLDRHAAWKVIGRLARAAGIDKPISPHSLRHTAVTLALDAGAPLHRVQQMAGHADPRTTQRYNRQRDSLDNHSTYVLAGALA